MGVLGLGFEAVAFLAVDVALVRVVGFAFGFALGLGLALVGDLPAVLEAVVFGSAGN